MDVRSVSITSIAGADALKMWHGGRAPKRRVWGKGLSFFQLWFEGVTQGKFFKTVANMCNLAVAFCG